jgi:hypothetical protein
MAALSDRTGKCGYRPCIRGRKPPNPNADRALSNQTEPILNGQRQTVHFILRHWATVCDWAPE